MTCKKQSTLKSTDVSAIKPTNRFGRNGTPSSPCACSKDLAAVQPTVADFAGHFTHLLFLL
jgi:hypothetical protein